MTLNLDEHINKLSKSDHNFLRKRLKCAIIKVIFIDTFLLIWNSILFSFYKEEKEVFFSYIRSILLLKIFLLAFIVTSVKVEVTKIYGPHPNKKILRIISYYTSLGIWLIIGNIEMLISFIMFFIDIYYISTQYEIQRELIKFINFIVIDFFYMIEYYLSLNLIYKKGVYKNLRDKLKTFKSKSKSKSKSKFNIDSNV